MYVYHSQMGSLLLYIDGFILPLKGIILILIIV